MVYVMPAMHTSISYYTFHRQQATGNTDLGHFLLCTREVVLGIPAVLVVAIHEPLLAGRGEVRSRADKRICPDIYPHH